MKSEDSSLDILGKERSEKIIKEAIKEYKNKGYQTQFIPKINELKFNGLEKAIGFAVACTAQILALGNVEPAYYFEEQMLKYFVKRKIKNYNNP